MDELIDTCEVNGPTIVEFQECPPGGDYFIVEDMTAVTEKMVLLEESM